MFPRRSLLMRLVRSPAIWALLVACGLGWWGLQVFEQTGGGRQWKQQFGLAAAPPLIALHAIVSVSPFPGEVVATANSMLFGFAIGFCCNWIGWMIGSVLQFGLVRRAANDLAFPPDRIDRLPVWLRRFPVAHPVFLICGRWIPFGGHVVNIAAGAGSVSFARYLWCCAISLVPVALLFAAIGNGLAKLGE